jgi:predicted solute-binding protein
MKTLYQIRIDSTKSIMEREMAASRQLYPRKKRRAIENHAAKMGIPITESQQYYNFVSASLRGESN